MVKFSSSKSVKTAAIGVLTVGILFVAPSAFAADSTVTQEVTGGSLGLNVTGPTLASVATSHAAQVRTGAVTIAVDDLTGTGAGWSVNQRISDFSNGTNIIPASNFSVDAGSATSTNNADMTGVSVGDGGSLDVATTVLSATAGSGVGAYELASTATLVIPADVRVGTYNATLTTSVVAGP